MFGVQFFLKGYKSLYLMFTARGSTISLVVCYEPVFLEDSLVSPCGQFALCNVTKKCLCLCLTYIRNLLWNFGSMTILFLLQCPRLSTIQEEWQDWALRTGLILVVAMMWNFHIQCNIPHALLASIFAHLPCSLAASHIINSRSPANTCLQFQKCPVHQWVV